MFCINCHILRKTNDKVLTKFILACNSYNTTVKTRSKGMEEIPSPRGLPIVGTTLSLIMAGSTPKLHRYIDKRHKQLGPIFKESVGPVPCVFISDPDAIRLVFANEGKYPIHLLPEAWTTYNTLHNVSRGLFFMNGEEWLHFRRILNPLLLKREPQWLEDSCRPAIDNLLEKLHQFSNSASPPKIEELLYRWSLEVIISVLIGPKNYTKAKEDLDQQIAYLASIVHMVFETSSKLALIPSGFASKYRIPRWKKFEAAVTSALQSAAELVELLSNNYAKDDSDGLLGKIKGQMTANELAKIVTDLILAAGDTTAYSMEWLLYLVGKHPNVQEKLREELRQCQKKGLKFTTNPYLKNVVKESLRLYPVAPFLTRILPESTVIQGYTISAGTILILSIFTTGRDETNFKNPLVFDPDRWVRNEIRSGIAQSASLPFAIGARSCIGKKLAETQLQMTLAETVQKFDFKITNRKNVDVILKMVAVPSEEIRFNFKSLK